MIKICVREQCQISFETNDNRKKYCSRSCATTVNNQTPKRRKQVNFCNTLGCEKVISRGAKNCKTHRYCDTIFASDNNTKNWLLGVNHGSYANGKLAKWARDYLIEQANNRCTRCGWCEPNPKLGKPILTIDHIDGNWKNNSVDNLVVLCYNCHTLTPTFNALNIGNGAGIRGSGNRIYGPLE